MIVYEIRMNSSGFYPSVGEHINPEIVPTEALKIDDNNFYVLEKHSYRDEQPKPTMYTFGNYYFKTYEEAKERVIEAVKDIHIKNCEWIEKSQEMNKEYEDILEKIDKGELLNESDKPI